MEQSLFIRTTTFGGFDKADVDKVFKALNTKIYTLESELRECELLMSDNGIDPDKLKEDILAESRKLLSEAQAQNETYKKNIEGLTSEVGDKEKTITSLNNEIDSLKKQLNDANKKIESLTGGESTALSKVFIEAQKSADMLVADSKKQADDITSDAKKLVENMVTEANNKAAEIVYAAEKKAAQLEADAQNSTAEIKASSVNLRAAMLDEVKGLTEEMTKLKSFISSFEKAGMKKIADSEEILTRAEATLTVGGVPQFTSVKTVSAKIPKEPKEAPVDYNYKSTAKKEESPEKNQDLDKLMQMAASLGGGAAAAPKEEAKGGDDGGLDLDSLLKQAESL